MPFPYDDEELDIDGLETPVEEPAPQEGVAQPAPEMNPVVKDYIQKKFDLGNYNDDARRKLVEENSGYDTRGAIAGALAALGGKDPMAILNARNQQRQQAIADFDKARANKIQEYSLDRQIKKDSDSDDLMTREADINSSESKMANELAQRMGYKGPPITAKQFKNFSPAMQKMYDIEQRQLDRKEARDERRFQSGLKSQERKDDITRKDDEKREGRMTTFGEARTEDDAKKLKEASAEKEKFDSALKEMISLREKHGGGAIMDREDVARGKQLSKDLMLAYKNMASLGVLSKSDQDILNKIIPDDPLAYNNPIAAMQGQDPILSSMKKFKDDSQRNFETNLNQRLRGGYQSQVAKPGEKTIVKTQTNKKTGAKRVVYSDGSTEEISATAGR